MSSSDRRKVLWLLAAAPLAACGFQPAFAPGSAAESLRHAVLADAPHDKNGYDFVAEIDTQLGRANAPRYGLAYSISTSTTCVAITTSWAVTRYQLIGGADYVLRDLETGKVLTQGHVNSFVSYSAAGTTVSTLTDEEAANSRLMVILADQVVARLIATAGHWAP